jgi:hypothetical protein
MVKPGLRSILPILPKMLKSIGFLLDLSLSLDPQFFGGTILLPLLMVRRWQV